jgi:hypothetical protein
VEAIGVFDDFEEDNLQEVPGFFWISAQHSIKIVKETAAVAGIELIKCRGFPTEIIHAWLKKRKKEINCC